MTIGSKIKEIRLSKGLTQKQLGELCGMADSAIRRYESGRGNPTEKTLSRIADALGVFLIDLVPAEEFDKISPARLIGESVALYYEVGQNNPNMQKSFEQLKNEVGFRVEVGFDESENKPIYDIILLNDDERLITAYRSLNDDGKKEAVKRVEELAQLEQYQKQEKPPESLEKPLDGKK